MKKQTGFTLIELLVVISIITLLASVALVDVQGAGSKGQLAALQADTGEIIQGIEVARDASGKTLDQIETGICTYCFNPSTVQVKDASAFSLDQINQSWLRLGFPGTPKDPWGNPFVMRPFEGASGADCYKHDQIYSPGPDGYLTTAGGGSPYSPGAIGQLSHGEGDDYIVSVPFFICQEF